MVDDLLAHLLGDVRDVVIVFVSIVPDPIQEIDCIVFAQVPMELRRGAQADEDFQDRDDDLSLRFIFLGVAHLFLRVAQGFRVAAVLHFLLVLVIKFSKIVIDSFLSQSDEAGDTLSIEDGTVQLDEV